MKLLRAAPYRIRATVRMKRNAIAASTPPSRRLTIKLMLITIPVARLVARLRWSRSAISLATNAVSWSRSPSMRRRP
jgi:hypothetical protein